MQKIAIGCYRYRVLMVCVCLQFLVSLDVREFNPTCNLATSLGCLKHGLKENLYLCKTHITFAYIILFKNLSVTFSIKINSFLLIFIVCSRSYSEHS